MNKENNVGGMQDVKIAAKSKNGTEGSYCKGYESEAFENERIKKDESKTHESNRGNGHVNEARKDELIDESKRIDMKDWGFRGNERDYEGTVARVIAEHRERYELICPYGKVGARLKTREYYKGDEAFPTVGDFVLINYTDGADSLIVKTLPRETYFSRRDPDRGRGEQAVAANFDYVMILQSQNNDFNPKRLERYLSSAYQSGAVPAVVLTKSDLSDNTDYYVSVSELYAAGAEVISVSAQTGTGLDGLKRYLGKGTTLVFMGSSGVGKSSLVNALAGKEIMTTQGIREDDGKGRHTTTHRQMIMLDCGAMIIDTPGMRELGMWGSSDGVCTTFSDVEGLLCKCKYRNCRHESEPGCAVLSAIESGELSRERWKRYKSLLSESRYSEDKDSYLKSKKEKFKRLSLMTKKSGKYGK